MSFDLFVDLAKQQACPRGNGGDPSSLASGFVDGCTSWFGQAELVSDEKELNRKKNEARRCYMERAKGMANFALPAELDLSRIEEPPNSSWIGIEVGFKLETPWYSKDDRPFHVLDNPVRKDRVFGVPFMPAASWKGLLRWACRMHAGLLQHFQAGKSFDEWEDCPWIVHLFGNEKSEDEHFHRGALAFYPTWFPKIGFEVINPHSRVQRAGTQPIYYEVVPAGTKGTLQLLYAPLPGSGRQDALPHLIDSIEQLLTTYGISAKRTVGWGTASIQTWTAWRKDGQPIQANTADAFKQKLAGWLKS
jgi:CRISPR-associated protein Cmr2